MTKRSAERVHDFSFGERPPSKNALVAFPLTTFANIKLNTERRDYLVKGLLPSGGLVLIWGQPKCGKSYWAMDLALHVALGREYRGRRVQQASVVYCALEGRQGISARIEAFRQHHGVHDAPFHLMTTPLDLARRTDALLASIEAQLGDERPGLVVVDTLNRSFVGSESSDEDMAAYIAAAAKIEQRFGCTVIIVHHSGHDQSRPRGHSSLTAAVEVQIAVKRGGDLEIIASIELAKDMAEGTQIFSRMKPMEVGTDLDGDPLYAFVVVEAEASTVRQSATRAGRLPKAASIALRALTEAVLEQGAQAPASNHIPNGAKVVSVATWRQQAYLRGISTSGEERAKQMAFKRAAEYLIGSNLVGTWNDQIWIIN
jgi:hypothetical protein